MNRQRKIVITITYNEMGIIIDTKAEEVAQPEPKKGEWIPVDEDDIPYGLLVECSKCGHRIVINDALEHNYCSECGADMRGKQT